MKHNTCMQNRATKYQENIFWPNYGDTSMSSKWVHYLVFLAFLNSLIEIKTLFNIHAMYSIKYETSDLYISTDPVIKKIQTNYGS